MVQKYTTSTRNDENYTTNKRVGIRILFQGNPTYPQKGKM
jgi:hypothetical protein